MMMTRVEILKEIMDCDQKAVIARLMVIEKKLGILPIQQDESDASTK